ncbi:MAG: Calx-beta domain-containing protein, partial [Crocosphaera sp.]|nr:Calx-beta domain-containing protein [Crocosphaera sp.]
MNNLDIFDGEIISDGYLYLLQDAQILIGNWLEDFANSADFLVRMGEIFGEVDIPVLQEKWQNREVEIPEIRIVTEETINGAYGAFARSNGTIYLAEGFLIENEANISQVAAVLLEELGHAVDAQLNPDEERIGDEGELFSAVVRGINLTESELIRIQGEDDRVQITLDGKAIEIEQARVNRPSDNRIAAVLGGYKWGVTTITYSFYSGGNYYGDEQGVRPVSEAIKKSVRDFLENIIEPLINVNFVEVNDSPTNYGLLRYLLADDPGYAYAYYPFSTDTNQGNSNDRAGDIFFNTRYDIPTTDTDGFQGGPGTHGYTTLIHETLHALGLKHPGDYNGNGTGDPPFLPFDEDNLDNTVMTYNFGGSKPATPMPYDLLALQYLYGARSYNVTNTTYTFSTVFGYSDGQQTIGNLSANNPTKLTIWDSGGIDTLDFSALGRNTRGYRFDLREGGWLTTNNAFNGTEYDARGDRSGNKYLLTTYGTRLGYGVQIEKAIGTSSNDTFYGNSLDNSFFGRLGSDIFYGGSGDDIAIYSGTRNQYQINNGNIPGVFTIADSVANRDGTDTLNSIERIQFSDQTISLVNDNLPTLAINDVVITEGNSGTTNAVFTVTRSGSATQPITVRYATSGGTATSGSDFTTTTGTLTFAINETTKTILVPILGDTTVEANETFSVKLSNATNATIADAQGEGTITNDDAVNLINDNFANRSLLSGNQVTVTGTNIGATGEAGEPNHADVSTPINSVWWRWRANADGEVTLSTDGSDFDTTLGVYTGNSVSNLTTIVSNDDIEEGINRSSLVTFSAIAGTTYQIAVDGWDNRTGNINLDLDFTATSTAPINDNFANRSQLTGDNVTATGTNSGATAETGEPNHAAVSTPINSVWWRWTATANGEVILSTDGSDFDTTLGVYTGNSVSNLTTIASNDDVEQGVIRTSLLSFSAIAGTTYQIAVDGWDNETGNINLGLDFTPNNPINDNFANRSQLTGDNVTVTGTNIGATGETGEPNHADVSTPINSVWWRWTATADGDVTLSTDGSDFDTTLGVYTGNSVSNLTTIVSNDDVKPGEIRSSIVTFSVVSGTTYQIAVDGYDRTTGNINLDLDFTATSTAPLNDNFANRSLLTGNRVSVTGTNIGATAETGEPNHAAVSTPINSVWWSWTANANGEV